MYGEQRNSTASRLRVRQTARPSPSGRYSAFAHIGGFAAEKEVVARRREEIDHLGVFRKTTLRAWYLPE
jgi:hypothetical protein